MKAFLTACLLLLFRTAACAQQTLTSINPGQDWPDTNGIHINAHGGCVIYDNGLYYWYGENRPSFGFTTEKGVEVYSSADLINWTDCGVALAVSDEPGSPIERGCIMERPKVMKSKEGKYVMLFHLELKGRGYEAALTGFAESNTPTGPFRFVRAMRPNPGVWPADFTQSDIDQALSLNEQNYPQSWTPEWKDAVKKGLYLKRDLPGGQMSRDMTIFTDDDGTAYHIYAAEDNLTLNLAELTPDLLGYTGHYIRIAPCGQNEAPAMFKRNGQYWLITSGCTGWEPNEARMFKADSVWGPWQQLPTPFTGDGADKSFRSQGCFIFKIEGTDDAFIFMADRWNPRNLKASRHIWLPIDFSADETPVIRWTDSWSPADLR